MQIQRHSLNIIRILSDILTLSVAFIIADYFSAPYQEINVDSTNILLYLTLIIFWVFAARGLGLYDDFRSRDFAVELVNTIRAVLLFPSING